MERSFPRGLRSCPYCARRQTTGKKTQLALKAAQLRMQPDFGCIRNVCFEGQGGTGLKATASLMVEDCVFRGREVGALASETVWIAVLPTCNPCV